MKKLLPWQGKIFIKVILSKLPFSYRIWERLGLFKHGGMTDPAYAYRIFEKHFSRVEFGRKNEGFVALELGPGDSLFSAVIARAFGAQRCYMMDAGAFASMEESAYKPLLEHIKTEHPASDIKFGLTVGDLMKNCDGVYGTQGLASLRKIPDQSVDFVWSQAVLEHVRVHEFDETMRELKRILRKDGVCSHRVDLKDHLGGDANNLRISSRHWESDWMSSSGFYTNRIRFTEMIARFEQAGFAVDVVQTDRWDEVPIARKQLSAEFRDMDDQNLLISGFDVILKPQK
jgi:SAM-dependent methyltransferase